MILSDTFESFTPKLINITDLGLLPYNNLIVYGETHGARENADIVYSLCNRLNVNCLAIEYGKSIDTFIRSALNGKPNYKLLNTDMFDTSFLSIEMLKTIVYMLRRGIIQSIEYLDESFDFTDEQFKKFNFEDREAIIANNIIKLNDNVRTLCALGGWHTTIKQLDGHVSALARLRVNDRDLIVINNKYTKGSIRNAGDIIHLPHSKGAGKEYRLNKVSPIDYELIVPSATPILNIV